MATAAVRASTTQRARKGEVFDKMTTVRGFGDTTGPSDLMQAIAATVKASSPGTGALADLKDKLQKQERSQGPSHKASFFSK